MSAARRMPRTDRNYSEMAEMEVVTLRKDAALNQIYCQVDMSKVYFTASNNPIFELSTVHALERNIFEIVVAVLLPGDGGEKVFTSPSFLVKNKEIALKRKAVDDIQSNTSVPSGDTVSRIPFPAEEKALTSVHIERLRVEKAFIRELECEKVITSPCGDIGYHFALQPSTDGTKWKEGTVVAFLSSSSGETNIEELSAENIGQAKLAGVITRSAYIESSVMLNKMDPPVASDIVCLVGTVKVNMLGNVANGEAVFASPDIPGSAVSKSNLLVTDAWGQNRYIMLGQALETKDAPGPDIVHEVQCLVSLPLGVQSRDIMQVVKDERENVRHMIESAISRERRQNTRNSVFGVISTAIFVLLLGVVLQEFLSRGTALHYHLCRRGGLDQATACLKFQSPFEHNLTHKIKGYEFHWEVLQNKLGIETRPLDEMVGLRFRYFLNIDHCAYRRVWFRNRAENKFLVLHGIEIFATPVDKGNIAMYYLDNDDDWKPLKSVVEMKIPC